MDTTGIFIILISVLFGKVYLQDVTVSLKGNPEKPHVNGVFDMTCTVSGTDLSPDTLLLLSKINSDLSSVVLADKRGATIDIPDGWLSSTFNHNIDGTPGGSLSVFTENTQLSENGNYSCTLIRNSQTLGKDTFHLDILYLPSISPLCIPDPYPESSGSYYDGEVVTFSCSSDPGNPTVNLTWSRGDGLNLPQAVITETQQNLISEITVTLSISDSGIVFTCTRTSDGFPENIATTCTPTSISVVPRPTTITTPSVTTPSPSTIKQRPTEPSTSMKTAVASEALKTSIEQTTSQYLSTSANLKASSESSPTQSFLLGIDLRIWIIAGGSGGLLIIVILIISLCCIIRYCKCCRKDPKLILPTRNGPSSYYNDIKLEPDLEMRQTNNGKEGIVPHVSSADGTLYARVNKDRKSINSRHFRKQDDPPPYPDSEFDDSSQGGYYHDYNGSDEQEQEPPKRTASERLYEIPPSDSDNEEPVQEDQYGNVTNVKPSYLDDLDPHYGNLE